MKLELIFSFLLLITLIVPACFAQQKTREELLAEIKAKITPEAIEARIEEIRMGDIIVKTKRGADIKIEQVRHEFLFGTAIPSGLAEDGWRPMSGEEREMFLQVLEQNFNYAVHENALKWDGIEYNKDEVSYKTADRIWELCNERNIPMRGHCLFWEKDEFNRPWVKELNNDELRRRVINHAIDVTKHFKGRIEEFDLNNEMIDGDFFRRRLGYGVVNEMAYAAKYGNPDITLYVNDYGILADRGRNTGAYVTQIKNLLAMGVPIEGIGCQGHMITPETKGEDVQANLDRVAQFNLPIKITECLFMADDEKDQADALKMFFPICFAHPNVESIIMWGFWAKGHWIPKTAMWKEDWTPTAQVEAYRDLVFNKWWTKTSGKADRKGEYKTRAFYGDYKITSNGKTKEITLSKKDKTVTVEFQ